MADEGLVLVDPATSTLDLVVRRVPTVVLEEATKAAKALQDIVASSPNKLVLNGKQYLFFEHWMLVGRFFGVTAKVVDTRRVEYGEISGFEARAVALRADGAEISAAEAACLTDEANWAKKPLFQLKSMAQTRAAAKALRTVLSWVVVLAGYEPTPAEEMAPDEEHPVTVKRPAGKSPPQSTQSAQMPHWDDVQPPAPAGPDRALRVTKVVEDKTKNNLPRWTVYFSDGQKATTLVHTRGTFAAHCAEQNIPVRVKLKATPWGDRKDLLSIDRADEPHVAPPLTDDDVPF
jgi:hypothetical protein